MIIARGVSGRTALQHFTYPRHIFLPRQALQRKKAPNAPFRRPQSTAAPQRPTLTRRILRTLLIYTTLSTTAFITGAYLALSYLPDRDAFVALIKKNTISDAETLTLYTPPDDATRIINDRLRNSPLARELRDTGNFTEARPHLKIPDALKPTNLTGGTLAGPGRITVPPILFSDGGHTLTAFMHLGPQLCGHPGIIHGGLLATLLDEGLARCCFPALPNKIGVTASLTVTYRKPVRADRFYALRAETVKVEGRKAWVKGWIEEVDCEGQVAARSEGGRDGPKGEKVRVCEAEGLFVEPRNAARLGRLYANKV